MRTLTNDQLVSLRKFYVPDSSIGIFLILCLSLGLGMGAISILSDFVDLPGVVWFGAIAVIIIICLLLRKLIRQRRLQKATFVYENGTEGLLVFQNIANNWGYTTNNAPQQIISLSYEGKPVQVKTFSDAAVQVYTIPQQKAYAHSKYPGFVVPSGLFHLQYTPVRQGTRLRRLFFILLPVLFFCGLFWIINHAMSSHSDTHAQPDARLFYINKKLVMATVISKFKANEIDNGNVYGSDYSYAEAIDVSDGKKLWKVPLKNKGKAVGSRLLGQSDKYLFFLHDDVFVVDKASGKIVAVNKDFPQIKDKMPDNSILDYMSDADYRYSDSLKALVIRGNDGLFYTIDGNSLAIGTTDIADPDDYFKNNYRFGNNYTDQIAAMYDDGHQLMALIDSQDIMLLKTNPYGVEDRSGNLSIRRHLYSCSSVDTSNANWNSLNPEVFIQGGFLVDPNETFAPAQDSISVFKSYQSLLTRYNHDNAPIRSNNGGFVIMHKFNNEKNAAILLTGISAQGKTLWQVNTGYTAFPFMYKEQATGKLLISGNNSGDNSDHMNEVIAIDMETGSAQKFAIN